MSSLLACLGFFAASSSAAIATAAVASIVRFTASVLVALVATTVASAVRAVASILVVVVATAAFVAGVVRVEACRIRICQTPKVQHANRIARLGATGGG